MRRFLLFVFLFLLGLIFIPIPEYRELNSLSIIYKMDVFCEENGIRIILTEVIPSRGDDGISYQYERREEVGKDLSTIFHNLKNDSSKNYYFSGVQKVVTNCVNPHNILSTFKIHPKSIKYKKN